MMRKPPRLRAGDTVRLVSPASTPIERDVNKTVEFLKSLGLQVQLGKHVFDRVGYLAGSDEDRLSDLNHALRDPDVNAVIATRGGKGAYRIASDLDFGAALAQPKLLIGFSEITILHLALLHRCGLCGVHGAAWSPEFDERSANSFLAAVFTNEDIVVEQDPAEPTIELTTSGKAEGRLIGGNQEMLATAAGWALPSFEGAILLIEAYGMRLGQMDRHLTMLENSGSLAGLTGIAVGQYTECLPDASTQGDWTAIDVLRDRLGRLGVPILGGLPIGHGASPVAVPIGAFARLDADGGRLYVESAAM